MMLCLLVNQSEQTRTIIVIPNDQTSDAELLRGQALPFPFLRNSCAVHRTFSLALADIVTPSSV